MCNTPALCAEATLQPLRRFPATLDAVVIFSDILIVPQAMGLEVRMEPGPVFPSPLAGPADLSRLALRPDAAAAFAPLFEGIARTRRLAAAPPSQGGCGKAVPVIGFCGAPWTLMSYMVAPGGREGPPGGGGGGGKKDGPERARAWLYDHPEASHALLRALANVCVDLLVGAWAAGASVLQVFESAAGELPPPLFEAFSLPYLAAVAEGVRARVPTPSEGGPLLIVFPRAQHSALGLEAFCGAGGGGGGGGYDAISLDWGWAPREAAARVAAASAAAGRAAPLPLQGNLDPAVLFAPRRAIFYAARAMLQGFGAATPLVANLGHGMLPGHTPPALGDFFQAVALLSQRLRGGGGAVGDAELEDLEERSREEAEGRGDGAAQAAAALAVAAAQGCHPPPP